MKLFSTILAAAYIAVSVNAFSVQNVGGTKSSTVLRATRREAIESLATTAAAFAFVAPAVAVGTNDADDVVARIAAQNAAKAAAAREQAAVEASKPKKEPTDGKSLVLGAAGASVALSLPFFLPNLLRLGTKLASGGKNDGYGSK